MATKKTTKPGAKKAAPAKKAAAAPALKKGNIKPLKPTS